jgi:ABC-2 type transport system ATP-binding protein
VSDTSPLAVSIHGLTKVYGRAQALDGVELTVPQGSVFGFLGPNGAGKTTTLRILAGLARPTSGNATILGHDVVAEADAVHCLIGYLPDVPGFYSWMTAREFLELCGKLFGLSSATLEERIETLLDLAGLSDVDTRIGGYSRGMKQRLGVAQALVNAPRLLLLDEPTSALDPIGRRELLEMIAGLSGRTTVLFSTHILADVERVCDSVAILAKGRVVEEAAIDDLKMRHGGGHRVLVEVDDEARLLEALRDAPWLRGVERDGRDGRDIDLDVTDLDTAFREVPAAVVAQGLALRRLEAAEVSLEDVFVDLVEGAKR